jgi:hypothetical protein
MTDKREQVEREFGIPEDATPTEVEDGLEQIIYALIKTRDERDGLLANQSLMLIEHANLIEMRMEVAKQRETDALRKDVERLDNVCDTMRGALVDALTASSVAAVTTEPIIRWAREVVCLAPNEYADVRIEMTRMLRDTIEAYDAALEVQP